MFDFLLYFFLQIDQFEHDQVQTSVYYPENGQTPYSYQFLKYLVLRVFIIHQRLTLFKKQYSSQRHFQVHVQTSRSTNWREWDHQTYLTWVRSPKTLIFELWDIELLITNETLFWWTCLSVTSFRNRKPVSEKNFYHIFVKSNRANCFFLWKK